MNFDKGYWICHACATEKGGIWPDHHVATMAEKVCPYCEGNKQTDRFIAPWVDYNWPDKKLTSLAKNLRD